MDLKFCDRCKYFHQPTFLNPLEFCSHPKMARLSQVTGKKVAMSAHFGRMLGDCGADGDYFEPIPPPPKRWWQFWRKT